MRKLWVIAKREYRATVQTKAFIIAIVLMPIMMGGGLGVQMLMEGRVDTGDKKIAVLDLSGRTFATLEQAVEKRNRDDIWDTQRKRQVESKYCLEEVTAKGEDLNAELLALSDRVRKGELFAFIVIPGNILDENMPGGNSAKAVQYYSNQPTYDSVRRWLSRNINDQVVSVRLAKAGIDRGVVEQALAPVSVDNLGLVNRDESGGIKQAEKVNEAIAFGVPIGMIMLMFMSITITAGPLLNSVLEEKMQRIAEVLLGSVAPFELMFGKLIGYAGVSVTLVAVYFSGAYAVLIYYGLASAIPLPLLGWFVVYQIMSVLMFGSIFLALGACCNDVKEAQNLMMPVWLVMCIPMFTLGVVMEHPNSLFSVLLSLFPPCTPMLMILRMAIPPGIAVWEPIVGVLIVLLTTVVSVWAAGRVFRVGFLMQGKPPKLREIARWVVRG